MNAHQHSAGGLTRNQALVLDALSSEGGPLSAYSLLDRLRDHGIRAPLQVYRALDKLVEAGRVHRLESMNAFVACCQPGCGDHETTAFAICDTCGNVRELANDPLEAALGNLAGAAGFKLRRSVVELRGLCAQCT